MLHAPLARYPYATLPKRVYPRGRVAGDIIGYMGAIDRREYENILHEMRALELWIEQQEKEEESDPPTGITSLAQARRGVGLKDLEKRLILSNDYVGKTGIEGTYEQVLRVFMVSVIITVILKVIFCVNYLVHEPRSRVSVFC